MVAHTEQTIQLAIEMLKTLEKAKALIETQGGVGLQTPELIARIKPLTDRVAELNRQIVALVGEAGRLASIVSAGKRLRGGGFIFPQRTGKTVAGIPIEEIARIEVRT